MLKWSIAIFFFLWQGNSNAQYLEAYDGFIEPVKSNYWFGFHYKEDTTANNVPPNTDPYPSCGGRIYHPGVDINTGSGDGDIGEDVFAVANGLVVDVKKPTPKNKHWWTLLIKHKYKGEYFYSQYGHCNEILVQEGQPVKKGDHICELGDSGTVDAHLHFEIRENDHPALSDSSWFCGLAGKNILDVESIYEDPMSFINNHPPYTFCASNQTCDIARSGNIGWYPPTELCIEANQFFHLESNGQNWSVTNQSADRSICPLACYP